MAQVMRFHPPSPCYLLCSAGNSETTFPFPTTPVATKLHNFFQMVEPEMLPVWLHPVGLQPLLDLSAGSHSSPPLQLRDLDALLADLPSLLGRDEHVVCLVVMPSTQGFPCQRRGAARHVPIVVGDPAAQGLDVGR